MPMTITAATPATPVQPIAAPPAKSVAPADAKSGHPAAQPPAAASAASQAQQQAALNRMLVTYAPDQTHGADPRVIASLGKQITAAAKALNVHVTLPHAPASSVAGPTTQAASTATKSGKVNVHA